METREAFSWQDTGDIVEEDERGYLFLGRRDQNFKLPNGTFLDVVRWEQKLNAIPGIRRSIILPASGGLNVYLVCESGYDAVSLIQKSRLCMSRIDHYLRDVAELNEEDLPRNPKGIILRNEMQERANATS